jgi:transposase InsO family protein
MKDRYKNKSLVLFCRLFGVTRQAYYQYCWSSEFIEIEHSIVLQRIKEIRQHHPMLGGRKLYEIMREDLLKHNIKMGRDALFNLLASNNLLIKRKRRRTYTTQSKHWFRKYPNLIKYLQIEKPNQLWVSDITYWKTPLGFLYISFITDAYSHKIVGYNLADNLEAINPLRALNIALVNNDKSISGLVHHSDRGIQYCSYEYVKLLQDNNIKISMTENGDPLENAIAERINGIIKEEYLERFNITDFNHAKEALQRAVYLYNNERPHMSCNWLVPEKVYNEDLIIKRQWKNYYKKKNVNLF